MANYDSPKAAGRNLSEPKKPKVAGGASNQEQMTSSGIKPGPKPSAASGSTYMGGTQREFSGQLQFAANPYGSTTLKDALNTYKQKLLPAQVNPGPSGDLAGVRKAAGRTSNTGPQNF